MEKPQDFDTAKAFGDYSPLPAGGYVCEIIGMDEMKSKAGNEMVKIALDIFEGDEKGRFADAYKNDNRPEKKWPCVAYQVVKNKDGSTNGNFKAFTDSAVESNQGFMIQWGEKFADCFKGRLIGVVFGREQYLNDGEPKWSTKPNTYKSIEDIRKNNYKTPEDKYVDGFNQAIPQGMTVVEDEDIPF